MRTPSATRSGGWGATWLPAPGPPRISPASAARGAPSPPRRPVPHDLERARAAALEEGRAHRHHPFALLEDPQHAPGGRGMHLDERGVVALALRLPPRAGGGGGGGRPPRGGAGR